MLLRYGRRKGIRTPAPGPPSRRNRYDAPEAVDPVQPGLVISGALPLSYSPM